MTELDAQDARISAILDAQEEPCFDGSVDCQDEHIQFVVFFEGRSGSTYLIESLNSHPDIYATKEPLSTMREEGKDANTQLQWIREFLGSRPPKGRVVGFKTKIKDVLAPDKFAELLEELQVKIVLLQRRNRIKLLVSLFRGVQLNSETRNWNLYKEEERIVPVHIDVELFQNWLGNVEKTNQELVRFVEKLPLPKLSLYYEAILLNDQEIFQRVCSFLGVKFQTLQGGCIKHTSDDLREAVANFEELRSAYVGTRYEQMFDEVLCND